MSAKKQIDVYSTITRVKRVIDGFCRECASPRDRKGIRCNKCLVKHTLQQKIYRDNLKHAAYLAYGGYECQYCHIVDKKFLCLDHVNGGGNEQVNKLGAAGAKIYRWLKQNNYPPGFMQVLCYNCNHKKYISNIRSGTDSATHILRRRIKAVKHYGGQCACCGVLDFDVLCFDHVNGGGTRWRHLAGRSVGSRALLQWVEGHNYPDSIMVLCHNCNQAKSQGGSSHDSQRPD